MNRKTLTLLLLLSALPVAVWSQGYDLGGTMENISTYSLSEKDVAAGTWTNLDQVNKVSMFFGLSGQTFNLSAKGSYKLESDPKSKLNTFANPQLKDLNLDTLLAEAFFSSSSKAFSSFAIQVGRLRAFDPTKLVISHSLDGISVKSIGSDLSFGLYGGTTRLLNKDTSSIVLTNADVTDTSNTGLYFAAPRVVGQASVVMNDFFGANLELAYIYQQDLRDSLDPTNLVKEGTATFNAKSSGTLNTHHLALAWSGKIVKNVYLDLNAAGLFDQSLMYLDSISVPAYGVTNTLGVSGSVALALYSDDSNSSVKLKAYAASGDASERKAYMEGSKTSLAASNLYKGLTSPSFGTVFSPRLGNLITGAVSWTVKPLANSGNENVSVNLEGSTYFRSVAGPISIDTINTASPQLYLGSEFDATLNLRLLSDLGLYVSSGVFLPNSYSGGVFENIRKLWETKTVLYLSMSL